MLIRFSRGTGLGGAVVRWATWSWCAHVGFKLDDGTIIDATPEFGVAHRDAVDDETTKYYAVDQTGMYHGVPTVTNYDKDLMRWLTMQIGKPYDWTAIYGMAFRRDWHKPTRWFCSELVAGAWADVGYPLVIDDGKIDRITPRDLLLSPFLRRVAAPMN